MDGFTFLTPSPARVHRSHCALTGFNAFWYRRIYHGGPFWTEHFRICNYCGGIHPADLLELLENGGRLEATTKPGKWLVKAPNPVAGGAAVIGSTFGPVFDKHRWPQDLKHQLWDEKARDLEFEPTIAERLAGHFEHPATHPAPDEITVPLYAVHVHARQWPVISEAAHMEIHL